MSPDRRDRLLILLAGLLLYLPGLGEKELWTSYEARVAQVARQMLRSGTPDAWILPRLGEEDRLKKPPLAYWLAAASGLCGGLDEFTCRIPNALSAIGLMLLVRGLGARLHGRTAGAVAGLAVGTTGLVWLQGRSAGIEMPLLFFNTLALYAWWRSRGGGPGGDGPSRPGWLIAAWAALGLAFLQKGPVGPLLVLLIACAWLTIARAWRSLPPRPGWHALGLAAFLAIALPWYAAVLHLRPDAWSVWFRESAGRLEGFDHLNHPGAYYLLQMLSDGQPWVLAALLAAGLLRAPGIDRRALLLPLAWACVSLVFFSIPGSKKDYYLLPLYPALALLAGFTFAAAATHAPTARRLRTLLLGAGGLLLACAPALLLAVPRFVRDEMRPVYAHPPTLALAACGFALAGAASLRFARRGHFPAAALTLALLAAFAFSLYLSRLPALNRVKGKGEACAFLKPRLRAEDRIATFYLFAPEVLLWNLDAPVTMLKNADDLRRAIGEPRAGRFFLLIAEKDWMRLPEDLRGRFSPTSPRDAERRFWAETKEG